VWLHGNAIFFFLCNCPSTFYKKSPTVITETLVCNQSWVQLDEQVSYHLQPCNHTATVKSVYILRWFLYYVFVTNYSAGHSDMQISSTTGFRLTACICFRVMLCQYQSRCYHCLKNLISWILITQPGITPCCITLWEWNFGKMILTGTDLLVVPRRHSVSAWQLVVRVQPP
jgi:hypothetical protein